MDRTIIINWNSVVSPDDVVYFLGDFSFHKDKEITKSIIRKLNGTIHFIRGNHDAKLPPDVLSLFASVQDYLEIWVPDPDCGKQKIILLHYPLKTWNGSHRGSWSLFGHAHGLIKDDPNSLSIDVGVDCHNFTPISYKQVKALMKNKTFKPIDRHGNEEYK
jgi:calcineurin-like phosphoesterase family protein